MRLAEDEARRRLAAYDHGVLGTTHRDRGADLVPVLFAVDGDHVAIPIDTVKPKAAGRLQRERNLAADPRATLLIEHWDAADWSRLWWVRARLRWLGEDVESVVAESLFHPANDQIRGVCRGPLLPPPRLPCRGSQRLVRCLIAALER